MSIPQNSLSPGSPPALLLAPDNEGRSSRTVDLELAGVDLQQGEQGLRVRDWRLALVGNDIRLSKRSEITFTTVVTEVGITQVSLAFDQSMNYAVAYVALNVAKLRWFDSTIPGFTTLTLPADASSPFLSMDDKRDMATSGNRNDVILAYIRGNRLVYRQQRDRYGVERTLAWFDSAAVSINKMGMNRALRLQFEIVGLGAGLATGAVMPFARPAVYLVTVTSISLATPAELATNDLLYAVLMHRTAATPPAGWTLVTSQACDGDVAQTLSVYRKTTVAPADSNVSATFTQSASNRMGLLYFVVRRTDGTPPTYIGATSSAVNDLATNTINAPVVQAAGTELFVMLATSVNGVAAVNQPGVAPGMSLFSGAASQCRLGAAYQRRSVGQTNAGRFSFDLGTPVNNGLAAITLRFS
jgi:hypothetical protein